ncbi:hypothetical protein [Pseudoroseicyclus tamaricis]|uniref:Uncharacterized protein n=1 Tax=Pseudoroseicyclus tamaricis TaxID=2705421 RepID=A0A6B2JT38_9RHOB|nr:hypothetical protein [Pseudoroseicyclus tamaricis]NDV01195.1 hypothetical protein [Pseudoroseicyclus tamaricis]
MKTYEHALAAFKESRFEEIIDGVIEYLGPQAGQLSGRPDLIKLCDLALRSGFMREGFEVQDRGKIEALLDIAGLLAPLSHFRAALAFEDGDRKAGWMYLANASPYSQELHAFPSLGLNSAARTPHWPELARGKHCTFGDPVIETLGDGREARYAIVFSADSTYLKRFLSLSLASIRAKCRDYLAVYHVISPDEEAMALMRAEAGDDVIFYIENAPQRPDDKAYFASARFFAARRVVSTLKIPAFILDIDMRCEKNFGDMMEARYFRPRKTQLRIMSGLNLPWHKMVANCVYSPATPASEAFLTLVCEYLSYHFSRSYGEPLWWIDQNALFFAHMKRPETEFKNIPGAAVREYVTYPKLFEDKDEVFGRARADAGAD